MTPIILIAGAVFCLALWRRDLGVGAIILLLPAYLLRATFFGVPTTALEVSIYAVALAWIIHILRRPPGTRPNVSASTVVLASLWVLAWAISVVFSPDHQASLGAVKAWLIDPLLFGFIVLWTIQTRPQRILMLSATVMSGAIVALAGLAQLIWFRDTLQDNRLSSFFHPVANYAAMYLGPILVLAIGGILWRQLHRWWWMAVIIIAAALALTVSFGGYLAVGVGGLFLLWCWPNKKIRLRLIVILLGLAVAAVGVLSRTSYLSEKFNTTNRSSSLVRTQIWRTSWQMIIEHPLVGIGPNTYESVYRATIPKLYFPPLEWLVAQPHQLYLALWLETGLLGLLVFLAFMTLWCRTLWPRVRAGNGLAITSVAAMIAILTHGLVDTPLFKNDLMILFVIVLLLPWLGREISEETKN